MDGAPGSDLCWRRGRTRTVAIVLSRPDEDGQPGSSARPPQIGVLERQQAALRPPEPRLRAAYAGRRTAGPQAAGQMRPLCPECVPLRPASKATSNRNGLRPGCSRSEAVWFCAPVGIRTPDLLIRSRARCTGSDIRSDGRRDGAAERCPRRLSPASRCSSLGNCLVLGHWATVLDVSERPPICMSQVRGVRRRDGDGAVGCLGDRASACATDGRCGRRLMRPSALC